MNRKWMLILGLYLVFLPLAGAIPQKEQSPAPAKSARTLKVKVNYSGAGKVDKSHGITVFLFDSPSFMQDPQNAMPIGMLTAHENDEVLTFAGLAAETVYLVATYDEKGTYEPPTGPPPSGAPVALYLPTDPQPPTAIKLDGRDETEVVFKFDDRVRMP